MEIVGASKTPNLLAVFANDGGQDADFNASRLKIQVLSGDTYSVAAGTTTLEAGHGYIQKAYTFRDDIALNEGDVIDVYYGDEYLATVEVTAF